MESRNPECSDGEVSVIRLTACPACGSERYRRHVELDDRSRQRFEDFTSRKYGELFHDWAERHDVAIAACLDCPHKWYIEIPDEKTLSDMYRVARPLNNRRGAKARQSAAMVKRMMSLRKLASGKNTLLDFGAGSCNWSRAAAAAGFSVTAFEPNDNRGAEQDDGYEVVTDSAQLGGQMYALVHLEQVLEHLPHPYDVLRSLRARLHPDGILVARVPNVAKEERMSDVWDNWPFDGQRAHVMAPFEHLQGFTPRSLRIMVERAGYEPLPLRYLARHMPRHALARVTGRFADFAGQTQIIARLRETG